MEETDAKDNTRTIACPARKGRKTIRAFSIPGIYSEPRKPSRAAHPLRIAHFLIWDD